MADPNSDDEDPPQLSAHALAALQEFYVEQQAGGNPDESTKVAENWQLSQFWYSEDTTRILAEEVTTVSQSKRIACLSCPTLYSKLLQTKTPDQHIILLEYDRRFEIYGQDFVYYDYRHPLDLPKSLSKGYFDLVVADPPFLSEECLSKTAQTVKFLTRHKVILCTGAVMEEVAAKHLGVRATRFIPQHTRNLGNEFKCYINYDSTSLNSF